MRAGRLWLRWTGPAASGLEYRTPSVDDGGGSDTAMNRIESFSFFAESPITNTLPPLFIHHAVAQLLWVSWVSDTPKS